MQHNSMKQPGENIDVFSYATNIGTFNMYMINDAGVIVDITPVANIMSIGQDLCKVNVTLPDEECIVCFVLNGRPVIIRVGNPRVRYVFFSRATYDSMPNVVEESIPYSRIDPIGNLLEAGNLRVYGFGFYGFVPLEHIFSIIRVKHLLTPLAVPYDVNKACGNDGTILLQRGVWQMIAIPVDDNVYDGFLSKLHTQTGIPATDLIEVVSCYRGDQNKFLSFVPGITNQDSIHNFPLTYTDDDNLEIVAMWVKCKQWIHTADDVVFKWEI